MLKGHGSSVVLFVFLIDFMDWGEGWGIFRIRQPSLQHKTGDLVSIFFKVSFLLDPYLKSISHSEPLKACMTVLSE